MPEAKAITRNTNKKSTMPKGSSRPVKPKTIERPREVNVPIMNISE